MFSIVTVASSTRIPTANASPPSVMMLIVSPSRLSTITELKMDSGMETAMMRVLRQLPRKMRIMMPVSHAITKIDEQLAAADPDLFGVRGSDCLDPFANFLGGFRAQGRYQELVGLNVVACRERVPCDDLPHFRCGAHDHIGAEAEFLFDGFLDALANRVRVAIAYGENHVPALDVSFYVDAAQEGNEDEHGIN